MAQAGDVPVVRIRASRGWSALGLGELWAYRELLYFLIWREIKARYRQMALGPLWIVLVPLVNMAVFVVITSLAKIPSDDIPRPIFIYAALLPWLLFSEGTKDSVTSLVRNIEVVSKVYFPRMLVPLATACAAVVDFCAAFVVLVVMMGVYGIVPTVGALALPCFVLLAVGSTWALGLWLSAVAVKFRDVYYGIVHLLQVLFFASPVFYPASLIPDPWNALYRLNPMASAIEGFRWALVGKGHAPDAITAASTALLILLLVSGAYVFRRTERTMVDHI